MLARAAWDRGVAHPEGRLWAYLEGQPVAGTVTVTIPRQAGQSARQAELTIRYAPVSLRPPRHRSKEKLPRLDVWAVLAREETPPAGAEAVFWLLLTTIPVQTFEDACERVQWYTCRWLIEVYHKPPPEPPTLQQVTRWIAHLGGFLGRKQDGHPGPIMIWRGLQRLNDIAMAWQLFHPLAASP